MTETTLEVKKPEVEVHDLSDLSKLRGHLKVVGGSMSDDWNNIIANQTIQTLWFSENSDPDEIGRQRHAAVDALIGIKPGDEFEGMIAAQLIASHNASMECYRRAMIRDQSFEGRQEALNQANKLSRTYAALLDALNRHRGKGQQKVTVEHVHVHEGGQAIVGNVESRGEGSHRKRRNNPMHLPMHQAPRCRARTRHGSPCRSPAMKNGRCRMHGGPSPGAPKGNKNALKHGRYTAEAIAWRRSIAELIRTARRMG
jgi:hypothetical protein